MADTKTSALTSLAGSAVDIAADFVAIVDTGASETKKIIPSNLLGAAYTAAGDIVQASAAGVAARLGIGTALQVLRVNSGATAAEWGSNLASITLGTEQASTSGTSIVTSIPASTKRIVIMLVGVSTSGSSPVIIQLGDAGGVETSGYTSGAAAVVSGVAVSSSAGFIIEDASGSASATIRRGKIVLDLEDSSDFTWVSSSTIYDSNGVNLHIGAGAKALSAELTQVRITTVGGSQTFDAGAINISYE